MALSNFVYISNVDNLSDARYSAGMGVNLLGFNLDTNDKNSLNPQQFKEISEWISGVNIVGEFGDLSPAEVKSLLDQFTIDYILISDESQIHEFSQFDIPLILRIIENADMNKTLASTLNYCSGFVEYFLIESETQNLDEEGLHIIRSYSSQFPIILGYGVTIENAKTIVNELKLQGISLKGSSEIRPGYKDFDELADILERLEID
jgi:phosphoribosylanthranilate isomerase